MCRSLLPLCQRCSRWSTSIGECSGPRLRPKFADSTEFFSPPWGLGIARLLQYAAAIRHAETVSLRMKRRRTITHMVLWLQVNQKSHWQDLVADFFLPEAMVRLDLISRKGEGPRTFGKSTSSCASSPSLTKRAHRIELTSSTLPTFFDTNRRSGVNSTTLSLLSPHESSMFRAESPTSRVGVFVWSDDVSWNIHHAVGWLLVASGSIQVRLLIDPTSGGKLKIQSLTQTVNVIEEYFIARVVTPPGTLEDPASTATAQASSNTLASQPLTTPPHSMREGNAAPAAPDANPMQFPSSPFADLGVTPKTLRFLEVRFASIPR